MRRTPGKCVTSTVGIVRLLLRLLGRQSCGVAANERPQGVNIFRVSLVKNGREIVCINKKTSVNAISTKSGRFSTATEWIFCRNHDGISSVLGSNGSGKSTLLEMLRVNTSSGRGRSNLKTFILSSRGLQEAVREGPSTSPRSAFVLDGCSREPQTRRAHVDDQDIANNRIEAVLDVFPDL